MKPPKLLQLIRKCTSWLPKQIYRPLVISYFRKKIQALDPNTQIFLWARDDFGASLSLLHYIYCWQKTRGNTCIVVLTTYFKEGLQFLKLINPDTKIIHFENWFSTIFLEFLKHRNIHRETLSFAYYYITKEKPSSLLVHYYPGKNGYKTNYIQFLDPNLKILSSLPEVLKNAYLKIRPLLDHREDAMIDSFNIHYDLNLAAPRQFPITHKSNLLSQLNIQDPYVVMNINSRDYKNEIRNIRSIKEPKRYECIVNHLISLGYNIVIQGREEQYEFKPRKGLINYAKSPYCSFENDLILYAQSSFGISSKTGAELFGTICNIPMLGLNYTELTGMQPNLKLRFFPKFIRNKSTGQYLSWESFLKSPIYYQVGIERFSEGYIYEEMDEKDLISAIDEFIKLLPLSVEGWKNYTDSQSSFKSQLSPIHLDLFHIKGVPCDCYLTSSKHAN